MQRTKRIASRVLASGLLAVAALSVPGLAAADVDVQASNSCEDCDNETGDATAQNNAASFTGQAGGPNLQQGDNETELDQDADASSGVASSGQVIGAVDDGSGDIRIVATNHNEDVNNSTGNASAGNAAALFTGQLGGPNLQDGDNETDVSQSSSANSGDGISGQVIGIV